VSFTVFVRNWWKENPSWPNGLEPDSTAEKTVLAFNLTESDARAMCKEYNDTHEPGRLSRKAEYMGD
jgi:hypothetical protein